jgi:glycerophosphoryl diester phosphodiesterase
MENFKTAQAEGSSFISIDQLALLQELQQLCFFPTIAERKDFFNKVAKSANAKHIYEIKSPDFGTAYLTALAMLHAAGEKVFRPNMETSEVLYKMAINKSRNYQNKGRI